MVARQQSDNDLRPADARRQASPGQPSASEALHHLGGKDVHVAPGQLEEGHEGSQSPSVRAFSILQLLRAEEV